jgi:hypothetical protein
MSLTSTGLDQEMAACRDIHEGLVRLVRDQIADGMSAQLALANLYRSMMRSTRGRIASAYACTVVRDAERAP